MDKCWNIVLNETLIWLDLLTSVAEYGDEYGEYGDEYSDYGDEYGHESRRAYTEYG